MNIPIEFIIGSIIFLGSLACTFFITKKFYNRKHLPISVPTEILSTTPKQLLEPVSLGSITQKQLSENGWELEVTGTKSFDIQVVWNDGTIDSYSGVAPQIYTMNKPIGIIPDQMIGADRGISHQWALNNHHWN